MRTVERMQSIYSPGDSLDLSFFFPNRGMVITFDSTDTLHNTITDGSSFSLVFTYFFVSSSSFSLLVVGRHRNCHINRCLFSLHLCEDSGTWPVDSHRMHYSIDVTCPGGRVATLAMKREKQSSLVGGEARVKERRRRWHEGLMIVRVYVWVWVCVYVEVFVEHFHSQYHD